MLKSFHSMPSDEESPGNNRYCEPWNTNFQSEDSPIPTKPLWNHDKPTVREVMTLGFLN